MKTVALVVALVGMLALGAPAQARTGGGGPNEMPIVDPGDPGCAISGATTSYYDVASCEYEEYDEAIFYRTVEGVVSRCRTRVGRLWGKNVAGLRLFGYRQLVSWCYDGVRIRSVYRERAPFCPSYGCLGWDFKGHTLSNCIVYSDGSSPCYEKRGGWAAYLTTQGKFQLCIAGNWLCQTVLLGISAIVRADGSFHFWRSS